MWMRVWPNVLEQVLMFAPCWQDPLCPPSLRSPTALGRAGGVQSASLRRVDRREREIERS